MQMQKLCIDRPHVKLLPYHRLLPLQQILFCLFTKNAISTAAGSQQFVANFQTTHATLN